MEYLLKIYRRYGTYSKSMGNQPRINEPKRPCFRGAISIAKDYCLGESPQLFNQNM